MYRSVLITPDGQETHREHKTVRESWDAAKADVGDMFDVFWGVYDEKLRMVLVDDNGHAKNLPRNERATELYREGSAYPTSHFIVGNAVVLLDEELW